MDMTTNQYQELLNFVNSRQLFNTLERVKIQCGSQFSADIENYNIQVTGLYNYDDSFHEFMYEFLNNKIPEDALWWSLEVFYFLHEIGHIMTKGWSKNTEQLYSDIKEKFENNLTSIEFYAEYRNMKNEKIADKWAIDFINNNFEELNDILG